MYNQQLPQQPNLYPVPQLPQQPIQSDTFEQASKLIDLIDRLNQRRSGNIEPGLSQTSQFNTAQFQPANQQQLTQQELLLRNPQLLQQNQQNQQNQQLQQLPLQDRQTGDFVTKLQTENQVLKQSLHQLFESTKELCNAVNEYSSFAYQNAIFSNGLVAQNRELSVMAEIGGQALEVMGALISEREAALDHIEVLNTMFTDPNYLLWYTFEVWFKNLTANDSGFVSLLSEAYMKLVGAFEEKYKSVQGRYTPTYTEYLQSEVNGNIQNQLFEQDQTQVNAIKEFANALHTPGFGKQMQRQHSLARQQLRS